MYKKINFVNFLTAQLVLCLLFVSFVSAQNADTAKLTDQQITAKVTEYMDAAVKVDGFSGTILVARDGKPIVSKGYGMANIELGVPLTPKSVFRLGSVTKQFTGMSIAMLQERGKMSVSDPLCKYIENCPEAWKPITVKNLLTHTSGIINYTSFPDFAETTVSPMTHANMIESLRDKPLDFPVGEKFSYSNSGYYLLGVIIEKVSGKTYEEFLQENIFTPLGMSSTGYDDPLKIIKNRAAGYQRQRGEVINAPYTDMTVPYAAGSMYSTTGDLLIWDQALYTEKLVSKKSLDEIFTPNKNGYGYGWGITKKFNRLSISHGGGIYGFSTDISRFPDDNVTVIVLTNIQGSPAGRVSNDLAAIVFGEKYEIARERKIIALDSKVLEKYVGEYQVTQPSIVIKVTLEDGKLLGQVAWQSKFVLLPESETKFFSKDVNATITFETGTNGETTGLMLSQGGANIPAKKIK
ncbi:MAG: serine hydrolase [Acidobacteria bacterium]|nr:serine hydrolase [Acidobacteriota bacterium]